MNDYAIGGLRPHAVVEPTCAEDVADILRQASAQRLAVTPWGGGTRQYVGRRPLRYDLALSTRRLNRILAYHPVERTISVESGVTLETVQAYLAKRGQWLPWDPAYPERATIGGLLAAGAVGALRVSAGSPRAWTLGLRVALGDGRLMQTGRTVNGQDASYDSPTLHIGSLGAFGVIVEATFRVAPLPACRQTLIATFSSPHPPVRAVDQLRDPPLQPLALVALNWHAVERMPALYTLLADQPDQIIVMARFAGDEASVIRQLREAVRRCVTVGARTLEIHEEDDDRLWHAVSNALVAGDDGSLLLRAGAPSSVFGAVAGLLERISRRRGWRPAQIGLAGAGILYSRWFVGEADEAEAGQALAEARSGIMQLGGYVVVEGAPSSLAGRLDIWGPPPEGIEIMRAMRARWDPAATLNPGRFVV